MSEYNYMLQMANFIMMPNELALVGNKTAETRLGFAVLLKFFLMVIECKTKNIIYQVNELKKVQF